MPVVHMSRGGHPLTVNCNELSSEVPGVTHEPRFSIITSTLNCAEALGATEESLRQQTWKNFQWIIADGGSTDGTLDRLHALPEAWAEWFSEPDRGIYDAWNKACRRIDGDWVLFLGAADVLWGPETLQRVACALASLPPDIDFMYGNVVHVHGMQVLYRYGQVDLDTWQFCRPALPAHQGLFQRASLFGSDAPFDASYRIAGDSKFLLERLHSRNTHYVDLGIARMEAGGVSSSPTHTRAVMKELLRLEADLGYRIPPARRLLCAGRMYAKAGLAKLIGAASVERLIRAKQRLTGAGE